MRIAAMQPRTKFLLASGLALVLAASAALFWFTRPPGPVEGDWCGFASNRAYEVLVAERLAPYDYDALTATGAEGALDAVALVADVEERSYIPLFAMRSCTDLPLSQVHEGLRQAIDDPTTNSSGLPAPPADIEAGWFEDLGVHGLVTGWALIALRGNGAAFWDGDPATGQTREVAGEIQELLGIGLAHATNPDRESLNAAGNYAELSLDPDFHLGNDFTTAFIEGGSDTVPLVKHTDPDWSSESLHGTGFYTEATGEWEVEAVGPTVYGWAVLAPLLRFGDYHEGFLAPVATAIIEFDREHRGVWTAAGQDPVSFDVAADTGDPVVPVLEALSRNQLAAEAVFATTGDERVAAILDE